MAKKTSHKRVVIYTRYSTDMQRAESCEIQAGTVRRALDRLNISTADALIISDHAIAGTRDDRPGYQQVLRMCSEGTIAVLAVYDQSRLSRGTKVSSLIQDLQYQGGRFISVGENIDTDRPGWKPLVGLSEIHHSISNDDTARRVRTGLENRLRDGHGSNGNFPFGYRSAYRDANWAELLVSGRKPPKDVIIHEPEAEIVRHIFRLYADGKMSTNAISKELSCRNVSPGHIAKRWYQRRIALILDNERYIGRWTFGQTETVRDSRGRKRHVPADPRKMTVVERPLLRIVSDDLWTRVRARRMEVRELVGYKNSGPVHPRHLFPTCNLGGLIRCATCGSRLSLTRNAAGRRNLYCRSQRASTCTQRRQLRVADAEHALYRLLGDICSTWPDWLAAVRAEVDKLMLNANREVPAEIRECRSHLNVIEKQIANLLDKLTALSGSSPALTDRLTRLEREKAERLARLSQLEALDKLPTALPSDDFIKAEVNNLPSLLRDSHLATANVLARIFPHVALIEMPKTPCRAFNHLQLRVRVDPVSIVASALGGEWQSRLATHMPEVVNSAAEFILQVTPPTNNEVMAPRIAEMRSRGLTWAEIGKATGMKLAAAFALHKRYRREVAP